MTRTLRGSLATLALAFALPSMAAQTIYKWVDENGTVHYGERPPQGVTAEPVSVRSPDVGTSEPNATFTDPEAVAEAREEQQEQLRQLAEANAEREEEAKRLAAACAAQRSRLADMIPRSKIILQNPDGTSRMLDDDERQAMIDESQKFVDENCPEE
jgi:hypothetical protein